MAGQLYWSRVFCRGTEEEFNITMQGKYFHPSIFDDLPITDAAFCQRWDFVKTLLKDRRTNPSARNNEVLFRACHAGNMDVVKLLCEDKRVNCSVSDHTPIRIALENHHFDVARYLLNKTNISETDFLLHSYRNYRNR